MDSTGSTSAGTIAAGAKRRRVDELEDTIAPAFTPEKYRDICFPDASVVLQCLPSSIAFSVHHGVLSAQSEVFRDMFALPQPGSEPANGPPVVFVHDNPDKMYRLLKYVYRRQLPAEGPGYLTMILDLFELSLKYGVQVARDDCVEVLRRIFPDTLSLHHKSYHGRANLRLTAKECFRCIRLISTHEYWTIVPSVYARLLQVQLTPDELHRVAPDYNSAYIMAVLSMGRAGLQKLRRDTSQSYIRDLVNQSTPMHCAGDLDRVFVNYLYKSGDKTDFLNVSNMFQTVPLVADVAPGAEELCVNCREDWRQAEIAGRQQAWLRMPECFGLGTWDELRKKEAKVHSG